MEARVEKLESDVASLKEGQKDILIKLDEFLTKLGEHMAAPGITEVGESSQGLVRDNKGSHGRSNSSYAPKFVKLDFPRFKRDEDPTSWICRAEQFFEFQHTPESGHVTLASFHLEGDAQLWYQVLKNEVTTITWQSFKNNLFSRFGEDQFYDFFGELTKLKQRGSVKEYQNQFERLLAKVGNLPQSQQVSCFVSGLCDSIRTDVQAAKPNSLSAAIGLARLFEARDLSHPKISDLQVKKLTTSEMQERRAKGLCFNCEEKFMPGHRCKKLFFIAPCSQEADGDVCMEVVHGSG